MSVHVPVHAASAWGRTPRPQNPTITGHCQKLERHVTKTGFALRCRLTTCAAPSTNLSLKSAVAGKLSDSRWQLINANLIAWPRHSQDEPRRVQRGVAGAQCPGALRHPAHKHQGASRSPAPAGGNAGCHTRPAAACCPKTPGASTHHAITQQQSAGHGRSENMLESATHAELDGRRQSCSAFDVGARGCVNFGMRLGSAFATDARQIIRRVMPNEVTPPLQRRMARSQAPERCTMLGGSQAGLRDKTQPAARYDCAPQEAQARQQHARARKSPTPPDSHEERAQRAARELQVQTPSTVKCQIHVIAMLTQHRRLRSHLASAATAHSCRRSLVNLLCASSSCKPP